jgi:hypothetical protein
MLNALRITRPETLVRRHRAGFRRYWRWKPRSGGGRPQIDADLRALIRRMSVDSPLGGAPRIHGEFRTRFGSRSVERGEVHDQVTRLPFAGIAHLPSQPLDANRRDGPVRGSERHFRAALRLHHRQAGSATVPTRRHGFMSTDGPRQWLMFHRGGSRTARLTSFEIVAAYE